MRFLVIGLGSMGKRRIRCLQQLGYQKIFGFDLRNDRQTEVQELYHIKTYPDFQQALKEVNPDAFIISVPPDIHHQYIKEAIAHKIHFFVEGSVVDTDMDEFIPELNKLDIVAAPSATLQFHPAICMIKDIVQSKELGKISNIILHSGQYLPDWHTYERVSEYYVSNPATGGAREIVPFELGWVTNIFGYPQRVCGNYRKTISLEGADLIDDTYNCLLDYNDYLASVTVDVVSRHASRRLLINGDKKQLVWDWDINAIQIFSPETNQWEIRPYEMKQAADGYNANIGENMYIEELQNFIEAINGTNSFVNSMENDLRVLRLLYAIEESDRTSQFVRL